MGVITGIVQEPVGYTLRNGQAEMSNFFALLTNPTPFACSPNCASGFIPP